MQRRILPRFGGTGIGSFGILCGAIACLSFLLTAGIPVGPAFAQPPSKRPPEGSAHDLVGGLWITTLPHEESRHVLIVIDPVLRQLALYHVDAARGTLTLKTTRDIGPDLQLGEFNAQDPKPSSLRKLLDVKAISP